MDARLERGEKPPFTFCESVAAGSRSRWHIRRTTAVGPKFGGGIDTPSLCGAVKPPMGWDMEVRLQEKYFDHCCRECVRLYRERT